MNHRVLVVLADSAGARLYETDGALRTWTLVQEHEHPESRAHVAQLVSDKPGRVKQSGGPDRAAMEPHTPRKKVEAEHFARELAGALEKLLDATPFDQVILVTPPPFLGILRGELSGRVQKRISTLVEKDYLHLPMQELRERLEKQLKAS